MCLQLERQRNKQTTPNGRTRQWQRCVSGTARRLIRGIGCGQLGQRRRMDEWGLHFEGRSGTPGLGGSWDSADMPKDWFQIGVEHFGHRILPTGGCAREQSMPGTLTLCKNSKAREYLTSLRTLKKDMALFVKSHLPEDLHHYPHPSKHLLGGLPAGWKGSPAPMSKGHICHFSQAY